MKTAQATIVTVDLRCPYCGQGISAEDSSESFCHIADDLRPTIRCKGCGQESKIPQWVLRAS